LSAAPKADTGREALVYLCECGPIIKDAIDLDGLAERLAALPAVTAVKRHATLCSEDGRAWLENELRSDPEQRVVVVGCSPREHGATFMDVCQRAGVNAHLLAMANIREQCTWVTQDREAALDKAEAISRAAIARVGQQVPLAEREIDADTDVLVVGAGVAGLTAARMLAGADRTVHLIERSPAIGGRGALLGDVYPGLECASCVLEPLMDEVLHHPRIEIHVLSEVEQVLGYFGNFTVHMRQRARHVDPEACYGCRTCHESCPVEVPNELDCGLSTRRALYIPYEGALPNATLLDETSCLRFQGEPCEACQAACPFGAIDLAETDTTRELSVGAIVLATGAAPVSRDEPVPTGSVIDAMTLERMLSSAGPTGGELCLPGREPPRKLALIHCADENGLAPVIPCSKLCCMSFAKHVIQIGEKLPECEINRLAWERCVGGKGYREFAATAEQTPQLKQINLGPQDRVQGLEDSDNGVTISYTREGDSHELEVDLAVIAPPLVGSAGISRLAAALRLELGAEQFFVEGHERLRPFETRLEGVLVAGCARGPGDIQDAAAQGAAAAGSVLAAIVPGRKLRVDPATAVVDGERCGGCRTCVLTCPFGAVSFDAEQSAAEVNDLLCRGCGSCAAACPAEAICARGFTSDQLTAEIEAFLL
jgi:heterodisulfide reductase subunit A